MGHKPDPWVCGRASRPVCTAGQSRTGHPVMETGLTLEVKDICWRGGHGTALRIQAPPEMATRSSGTQVSLPPERS